MRPVRAALVFAALTPVSVVTAQPAAQAPEPLVDRARAGRAVARYDLARCLALAREHHPKIAEARARLRQKRAQQFQARTAPFSEFTATGGVGLAPTVFGTSTYSPSTDAALSSNMGLAWQVGIDGLVPLYTFGKLQSAWAAADAQTDAGRHEVGREANQVAFEVRRAYWGVQLSRDALALLQEAQERLVRYRSRLAERVEDEDADEIDLLKLQMHEADLEARISEARRQERVALAGLRFLTGVTGAFDIPDEPLARVGHRLGPLARYLTAARIHRPEVNMARAGVVARRAQLELERSRFYPDLGLALTARWARAPEVTDQTNPYVKDSANSTGYGFALAMRWKLDFLPQSARLAAAEAQLEEMRATERFALGGVGFEVEQAFQEAVDAARRLEAMGRASRLARQWLVKVQQGIDVGTLEEPAIVEPSREYATKRFGVMSATMDFNVAIARLVLATGWDAPLDAR